MKVSRILIRRRRNNNRRPLEAEFRVIQAIAQGERTGLARLRGGFADVEVFENDPIPRSPLLPMKDAAEKAVEKYPGVPVVYEEVE